MPSKKKGAKAKSSNNRGFATSSIPKRNQEPDPALNETNEPSVAKDLPDPKQPSPESSPALPQTPDSNVESDVVDHWEDKLIEKFRVINSRKVESYFSQSFDQFFGQTKEDEMDVPTVKLPGDIEHKILAKVRTMDKSDLLEVEKITLSSSSESERERQIAALDRIYLMLEKIGFEAEDIECAMSTTKASQLTDLLDWLCLTVPDEKLPLGFKDKAYYENDMSLKAEALSSTNANDEAKKDERVTPPLAEEPLTASNLSIHDELEEKPNDQMKEWILKAAQEYEDDGGEMSVNEQHAQARLDQIVLQKRLSQINKKKDTDTATKLKKEINAKKQMMEQLESDWEYTQKEADDIFIDKKRVWEEEYRVNYEHEQWMNWIKDQEEKENVEEKSPEIEPENDDGLFGLFEDQIDYSAHSSHSSSTLNVIDVSPRSSIGHKWSGRYPKTLLGEHCRAVDSQSTQSYTVTSPAINLYHASVKIRWRDREQVFSMEPNSVVQSKADAQEYVATLALYGLSKLPLYRSLPSPYREIWQEWTTAEEEEQREKLMELHRKRFRFIIDLIDQASTMSRENKGSPGVRSPVAYEGYFDAGLRKTNFSALASNFVQREKMPSYIKLKEKRSTLPIFSFREEILKLVAGHQIIIVSGETGCGKSTQVPQYLAEALLSSRQSGNIICTQPRRISAISIAQRVSQEMGDKKGSVGYKGSLVGYQIRLESRTSESNILQFCTTGILLRRLESDKLLQGVTHIVVDEVHERSIESDFLLIVLRQLCTMRSDIKVILMSATVDAYKFSNYFGGCPVVQVPGRTFPVDVKFLEDVVEQTEYFLEEDSPYAKRVLRTQRDVGTINVSGKGGNTHKMRLQWYDDDDDGDDPYHPQDHKETKEEHDGDDDGHYDYSKQTRLAIRRMDESKINYELIAILLEYIVTAPSQTTDSPSGIPADGAILIFLPGMPEIRKLHDLLASHQMFSDEKKYLLIPLHSLISTENQEKVFDIPAAGMRKIILSTNIAETGVTIEDVTVVIDTGMVKEVRLDDNKRITSLQQTFVSRANAKQRRGRAGRVQSGICFHLFTKERFETRLAEHQSPEIVRLPLEELCLRIKACGLGDIHGFLSQALDAPASKAIDSAISALQEVQALSNDSIQRLTPLGRHLSNLPVDVHIGKMLLFGAIFQCLDPILTIAAAMSFKSPFVRPFGKEDEADRARLGFRRDNSDFSTIYNAYLGWRMRLSGQVRPGGYKAAKEYCKKHYLSFQNLEMIEDMKKQFLGLLVNIGFVHMDKKELASEVNRYRVKRLDRFCIVPKQYDVYGGDITVINAAIAAALYPKFAFIAKHTQKLVHGPTQEIVHIHPSSILYRAREHTSANFMVFNTITKSDKVYLWDVTTVDDIAIMLFGGDMDILHEQKRVLLDQWIKIKCHAKTAVIFKFLRHHLNAILKAKIDQPQLDLNNLNPGIMELTIQLLQMPQVK